MERSGAVAREWLYTSSREHGLDLRADRERNLRRCFGAKPSFGDSEVGHRSKVELSAARSPVRRSLGLESRAGEPLHDCDQALRIVRLRQELLEPCRIGALAIRRRAMRGDRDCRQPTEG